MSAQPSGPTGGESVTGAQSLIKSLEHAGVTDIFGIPGGTILPAYDPLFDSSIRHILVRHEQGAGHAAQGFAAATGRVGVCMATSGPGATNLVTPLADANMDSVPLVAITGQVVASSIGTDAFQEADIRGITMPITKHSFLVTDPDEIPRVVAEAFHIASTGRPGPVLVDVAKSAQQAMTTFAWPTELSLPGYRPVTRPHSKQIREATRLMLESRRPVLYVGGGVIRARAAKELADAGRADRHPRGDHADGPGRLPRQPPPAPRHAGHARHRGRRRGAAEERPDHQPGCPLRRPRDRQPRLVRAGSQGDPCRHRPGGDRQEPVHRRPRSSATRGR